MNHNSVRTPAEYGRTMFGCFVLLILVSAFGSAQEMSRQRLNESPRHHEWVAVTHGERTVHSFLVYPEVAEKATAVVVIHENRGLTDWVCSVADQLAAQGYIAIAPDLLSGMAPEGGKTADFADGSAAREAIYQLPAMQVTSDLNAVVEFVRQLPAAMFSEKCFFGSFRHGKVTFA